MCTPRRVRDGSRGAVSNLRSRDHAFEDISTEQPYKWAVKLLPLDLCRRCEQEEDARNHEGIRRVSTIPLDYPECVPKLDVEIVFGLADENRTKFLDMAIEESNNNEGMPAICTICEVPREWLADNNVTGLDEAPMHVQIMRRSKEDEQKKKLAEREFERQKKEEEVIARQRLKNRQYENSEQKAYSVQFSKFRSLARRL